MMPHRRRLALSRPAAVQTAAVLLLVALASAGARADDRSLLEPTQKNPYVMIVLDTSGSMHQEIACTATDVANGFCSQECDSGDCLPRMMGDDPDSKIYVAKQSIYDIMATHPNINFGFAHFDQGGVFVAWKYWWYTTLSASTIKLTSGLFFPEAGQQELFGQQAWSCNGNGQTPAPYNNVGCVSTQPAHLDNTWEWTRARRWPKLGDANNTAGSYFFTESSTTSTPTYKVTYTPVGGQTLGSATIQVAVAVVKCNNSACSSTTNMGSQTMTWTLPSQTIYWDPPVALNGTNQPDASGNGGAYYGSPNGNAFEVNESSYLLNIDQNNDNNDPWSTSALCVTAGTCDMQQATTADPSGRTPANTFSLGDVIPLDWNSNQQLRIQQRMAPNLIGGATTPDFGIADYLADHPLAGETALRIANTAQRPLLPEGGTPTGHALMGVFNWLTGDNWPTTALPASPKTFGPNAAGSWIGTASAATGDPFFSCKPAYVLILTDGLASSDDGNWNLDHTVCPTYYNWINGQSIATSNPPGFACCAVEALRSITYGASNTSWPVRTYVIGLGLTSTSVGGYNNTLQCMADIGGTGNRHFFQGTTYSVAGQPAGYPASDPPPATFCTSAHPCDGPGPLLPQSKADILAALQNILNKIQSETTSFASAAVPSLQSNIANESILSSFTPLNQPVWPGRLDAYVNPIPLSSQSVILPNGSSINENLPDPTVSCNISPAGSPVPSGTQACHLWNAGDQVLAQGLNGLDTAGTDPTKRRVYYAPQTPIKPGELRLNLQMPNLTTGTAYLYDLENALGLCGTGYTFYPPTSEGCTENGGSATVECTGTPVPGTVFCPTGQTATPPSQAASTQQAITWTESIKSFINTTTNQPVQYLLGDIFHSNPMVLGQPADSLLFTGNVNGYQTFSAAQQFRRKVVYVGSNDGQLHAFDAGTVKLGTESGSAAWVFGAGTGNEIFSFVPRAVMPTLNSLATQAQPPINGGSETFMVDGSVDLAEGYFDATGGTNPVWHSLVIGGLREGGREVYALDVTQPDQLINEKQPPSPTSQTQITVQMPDPNAATWLPNCINANASCGQLPYPTPLWEFTDSCKVVSTCSGSNCQMQPCDEDPAPTSGNPQPGYQQPDLGQTWSVPSAGRVRICTSTASPCPSFQDKWVVIFGGGMDPANNNSQGNYLYMLDMATGAVIYKRQLNGSVPSQVAAIDTGLDGYIDTLYVGTTAGHLYKVDLTQPAPIVAISGLGNRVSTSYWQPFEIFNTGGRQMYYPPAVFYDATLNEFGLAWGTGNRQDLWKSDATTGRVYVMMDVNLTSSTSGLPFTASNLQAINLDTSGNLPATTDLLDSTPASGMQPGYYFELDAGERVLTQPFVLSGVLIFNSYQPLAATGTGGLCVDSGNTRVAVVNLLNGNSISSLTGEVSTSGSNPAGSIAANNKSYIVNNVLGVNITTTLNPSTLPTPGNSSPDSPQSGAGTGTDTSAKCDQSQPYVQAMISAIEKLSPSNCRFSNASISVTLWQHTGSPSCAAAVPVCIIEKNWKEF